MKSDQPVAIVDIMRLAGESHVAFSSRIVTGLGRKYLNFRYYVGPGLEVSNVSQVLGQLFRGGCDQYGKDMSDTEIQDAARKLVSILEMP